MNSCIGELRVCCNFIYLFFLFIADVLVRILSYIAKKQSCCISMYDGILVLFVQWA